MTHTRMLSAWCTCVTVYMIYILDAYFPVYWIVWLHKSLLMIFTAKVDIFKIVAM